MLWLKFECGEGYRSANLWPFVAPPSQSQLDCWRFGYLQQIVKRWGERLKKRGEQSIRTKNLGAAPKTVSRSVCRLCKLLQEEKVGSQKSLKNPWTVTMERNADMF